jgi:membrane-associated phospholipid phosphatase
LLVMTVLIGARFVSGHLPYWGKAMLVALVASLVAFAANELVLKILFGIPNPASFLLYGANHKFNFLHGNQQSSFPSGHMALAASFVFAFGSLYRKAFVPLAAMLFVAGVLLIVGDWHFLSDVLAGAFAGATAGLLAGELWIQHNKQPNA